MRYTAPVVMFPSWAPRFYQRSVVKLNIFLNQILTEATLRRLDARSGAKQYWAKIEKYERRHA